MMILLSLVMKLIIVKKMRILLTDVIPQLEKVISHFKVKIKFDSSNVILDQHFNCL